MFARSTRYYLVSVPSGGIRMSLCDVSNAFVRSLAPAMMIQFLAAVGICRLRRNHVTVLYMRVDAVEGVQMFW